MDIHDVGSYGRCDYFVTKDKGVSSIYINPYIIFLLYIKFLQRHLTLVSLHNNQSNRSLLTKRCEKNVT